MGCPRISTKAPILAEESRSQSCRKSKTPRFQASTISIPQHLPLTRRNQLDYFIRGRMIGRLEERRTVTSVAAEFGISKSVVSSAWKAFQTTGTAVRKANRVRQHSASAIAQKLSTATGRQVLRFTVARRLHKGYLLARHPER
ncbi:transposable element Tcb2 transposase [Trichonephila clavipes]|nr:transposable element Tcb2 transposase [Trichonephila clavipes]